jgi:3-phenylpropionate/cinnamic acid dioxygenase small subunit
VVTEPHNTNQLLARLLDERDVTARLYAYCEAADAQTPEAFLDCFTADGLFTYRTFAQAEPSLTCRGRAELERWFVERLPVVPPGTMNHTTVHPRVSVDGDRAEATSRYISIRSREGGLAVVSTGSYRDRLVRCEDGQWRLVERESVGDMPR